MKRLAFDSIGGASGDMILAAFASLGADMNTIQEAISQFPIEPFEIKIDHVKQSGFAGTQAEVVVEHSEHAPHRHLADIRTMIENAQLPPRATALSIQTFTRLAEAEASVHGSTPDHVHFHEVGAVDSIVDIVGSCLALVQMNIDEVCVGTLPLGCGETTFSHGTMPVPVPATVELLKGHPVLQTDEPFEMVTPTGAALLMTWKEALAPASPQSAGITIASGVALGQRTLTKRLNMLRVRLMDTATKSNSLTQCLVLECNMDDTIPELLGSLTQALLRQGALDVFTTSVQMKKQRPGTLLTVLCAPAMREAMLNSIFTESTTFGVREYMTQRTVLERRHETVETAYGTVRIKVGTWRGSEITRAPEHADCVACADKHGVPVRTVYEAALRALPSA